MKVRIRICTGVVCSYITNLAAPCRACSCSAASAAVGLVIVLVGRRPQEGHDSRVLALGDGLGLGRVAVGAHHPRSVLRSGEQVEQRTGLSLLQNNKNKAFRCRLW